MYEQPNTGTYANIRSCGGGRTHQNYCVPYSNPQVGDAFEITQHMNSSWVGRKAFIRNLMGPCNIVQNGVTGAVTPFTGCCINCDTYQDWSSYPPSGACVNSCSTTTSAGSCNPNAWSNHANWTSTFTNTVTNHNNPCNFLNNKIAQFTSNLQGTGGGNYQNIQNCKLDLANDLHTQNNC